MTNTTYNKIKENLSKVVAHYALQDYKRMNPNHKRTSINRKHVPYSLGFETQEAQELYRTMYDNKPETLTRDQEAEIKTYLLRIKRTTETANIL